MGSYRAVSFVLMIAVALLAAMPSAQAVTYAYNYIPLEWYVTGASPSEATNPTVLGWVTLEQDSGSATTMQVEVCLSATKPTVSNATITCGGTKDAFFQRTGQGTQNIGFGFNMVSGVESVMSIGSTIAGNGSGSWSGFKATYTDANSAFGSYNNEVNCSPVACPTSKIASTGTSAIDFTLSVSSGTISPSSFVCNGTSGSCGYSFIADVYDNNAGITTRTGRVGGRIPEPATLALLGGGLAMFGGLRRWGKRARWGAVSR